jgi:ferredoxin--NADP+ reductase
MTTSEDRFYRATVTQRVDFAPDLWSIRVNPGGEFRFQPGQYATLGIDGPERRLERPYSIVSSPYESELEFFFELVPDGVLTPELHNVQVGTELLLRKTAKGRFTLDVGGTRNNHLLISTVTGLAPFTSFIRTLSRDFEENRFPEGHRLFLLHGASRSWEFGYHEELQKIATASPWLTYVPTVSRPWEDQNWEGEVGRVDDVLRKYMDHWGLKAQDTIAYLCGHPEMIDNTKGILKRLAFPKDALREEVYWVPAKQASDQLVHSA